MFLCLQPKARTSSEESMAGEDDRARKPSSLYAPTPLIRTSSGTHVRPTPKPRSSRHSGQCTHLCSAVKHLFYHHHVVHSVCPRVCVCDPDPASLPAQLKENPPGLIPPELPPKGIRRQKTPSKVEQKIQCEERGSSPRFGVHNLQKKLGLLLNCHKNSDLWFDH